MARVGYARVSSIGQSLQVQLNKFHDCDKIFREKRSGTTQRPQLEACLDYLREGDTLVVTRLDRLARSTLHLCRIAEILKLKQVNLRISAIRHKCNVERANLSKRVTTNVSPSLR